MKGSAIELVEVAEFTKIRNMTEITEWVNMFKILEEI